jgi:hypothetical protein
MSPLSLHSLWSAPDNSRVTSRQYSFRLPVHVAAKVEALCEIYPTRTRTQIVGDLLASALQAVEQSFPLAKGKEICRDEDSGEMLYEDAGVGARFRKLANKHYIDIEKELGTEKPEPLYTGLVALTERDLKEQGK